MKSSSGQVSPVAYRKVFAWALVGLLWVVAGCAQQSTAKMKRPPLMRPPVQSAGDILYDRAVEKRAYVLHNTGKFKTSNEAFLAAQQQIAVQQNQAYNQWAAEQVRWQKQVEEREKFEKDFAKAVGGY